MITNVTRQMERLKKIAKNAKERSLLPFEAIDVKEIVATLKRNREWEAVIECYQMFSFLNKQQGNRTLARELIETALQAARELSRKDIEARLLHDLAEIHHQQGRNQTALELFEKSYSLRIEMGAQFEALTSKHMSVLVLRALGGKYREEAYKRAKEVLEEAKRLAKQDPTLAPWIAHPLEVLSMFARDQGDTEKERELLEEAIKIHASYNQDDRLIMLGQCYRRLGHIAARENQLKEAEDLYLKSIEYSQEANNQRLVATTLRHLGDLHVREKKYDKAMEEYSKAMNIAIDGGFTHEEIALSLSLARLYFKLGRIYDALEELRNAFFLRKTLR